MKHPLLSILCLVAVLFGGLLFLTREPTATSKATAPPALQAPDVADLFRKAFWRHPDPQDQIVNGTRREWTDADGTERWEWFLLVRPSPGLVKHLREDNVFGLTKQPQPSARPASAPEWFALPHGPSETLGSRRRAITLTFSQGNTLLLAHSSGSGFTKGAPEPAQAALADLTPSGRLPLTSPPTSSPP